MKIAFYIGTTFDMEGYKISIIRNMPKSCEVVLVKRFDAEYDLPDARQEWMHPNPAFSALPDDAEIAEAERSLGVPFRLLLRFWYNWDRRNEKDARKMRLHFQAIAQYLSYWRDFFSREKPDFFVTTYESTFPEIVSVLVAKEMGVKVMYIVGGRISPSLTLCGPDTAPLAWKPVTLADTERIWSMLRERFLHRVAVENAQVEKDMKKYSDYSPSNVRYKLGRVASYWRNYHSMTWQDRLRTISPFTLLKNYFRGQARQYYYSTLWERPDFRKMDYLLFPLQYRDEASTFDAFTDQFALIEAISLSLPSGFRLIVKPHPHHKARDVSMADMARVRRLANVVLIHPDTNTTDLILNSKGVFVVGSTTGYEACVLGKPVVNFGHDPLFTRNRAIITVHDTNSLPEIVMSLAAGRVVPDEKAAKEPIARYFAHLIFLEGKYGRMIDFEGPDAKKIANTIAECAEYMSGKSKKP